MKFALTHFDLTTESGDPKTMLSIANGLQQLGHTVVVYCAEYRAESCFPRLNKNLDVRAVAEPGSLARYRGNDGPIGKMIKRIRGVKYNREVVERMSAAMDADFDAILCENDPSYQIGVYYKKKNPNVKVVWIMNNPPFFHSPKANPIVNFLSLVSARMEKKLALRYASGIDWITVYDTQAFALAEMVGPPVRMVSLPIEIDFYAAPVNDAVTHGKKVQLLSMGALSPSRRFEDTITATALLRKKGYDARAVLICKDYWGDTAYRAEFDKFIKNSGVEEYIDARFKGVTEDEHLEIVRASNVFILPNSIKIWAMGAFEAMVAGLPLVTSRITTVAGILHDNVDALFVDPLHPEQIAEKVDNLMKDPALYVRIATAGKKITEEKLSVETYVRGILSPFLL